MEFDEQEDEVGTQENFDARKSSSTTGGGGGGGGGFRYRECLRNHALGIGGHALDGCGEFMAAGDDGTVEGLKCAACNCHRNFHRKEVDGQQRRQQPPHPAALQLHHPYIAPPPYYHHHRPTGYLHITPPVTYPHHQRPLALPSSMSRDDLDEISNPSSSGGGGCGGGSGSKKRFRTKFTPQQKDRMLAFSEALGWRIQKHDEAAVQQFCEETGVKRHVLKIWMHNNKHTIGKKP